MQGFAAANLVPNLPVVWLPAHMQCVVAGSWDHGSPIAHVVEASFASAFRPTDESVCAWIDRENQHLLRVTFDVEASSFEEAIEMGRAELLEGAHLIRLGGSLIEVVSMTDEGYSTWSA